MSVHSIKFIIWKTKNKKRMNDFHSENAFKNYATNVFDWLLKNNESAPLAKIIRFRLFPLGLQEKKIELS